MPTLKIEVPPALYEQLLECAGKAWRPPLWHAGWLLQQAITAELALYHEDEDREIPDN
jgi:hypothetical protein